MDPPETVAQVAAASSAPPKPPPGGASNSTIGLFVGDPPRADDPNSPTSVHDFLLSVELQARYCKQTDDDLVAYVPTLLRGTARDHYKEYANEVKTNWTALKKKLYDDFNFAQGGIDAMSAFTDRRQAPAESVQDYFEEKMRLARQAYDGKSIDERNAALLSFFILGLREDLRIHVQRARPTDYVKAKEHAVLEERLQTGTRRGISSVAVARVDSLGEQMNGLRLHDGNVTVAPVRAARPPDSRLPRTCYNCGRPGHFARACWKGRRQQNEPQRRGRGWQPPRRSHSRDFRSHHRRSGYGSRSSSRSGFRGSDRDSYRDRRGRSPYERSNQRDYRHRSPRDRDGSPRYYNHRQVHAASVSPRANHATTWGLLELIVLWICMMVFVRGAAADGLPTTDVPNEKGHTAELLQWCEAETNIGTSMELSHLPCDPSEWHNPNWGWSNYIIRRYDTTPPAFPNLCPSQFVTGYASYVNNSKGSFLISHEVPVVEKLTHTTAYSECYKGKEVFRATDGDVVVLHASVSYQGTHKLDDNFGFLYQLACTQYNRRVDIIRQMAVIDPTTAMRMYMNRSDIGARLIQAPHDGIVSPESPTTLDVWKCTLFLGESTDEDINRYQGPGNNISGEWCYEYRPVKLPDWSRTVFVHPERREFVSWSPYQLCPWNESQAIETLKTTNTDERLPRQAEYTNPSTWHEISQGTVMADDQYLTGRILSSVYQDPRMITTGLLRLQRLETSVAVLITEMNQQAVQPLMDTARDPPMAIAQPLISAIGNRLLRGDLQLFLNLCVCGLILERLIACLRCLCGCCTNCWLWCTCCIDCSRSLCCCAKPRKNRRRRNNQLPDDIEEAASGRRRAARQPFALLRNVYTNMTKTIGRSIRMATRPPTGPAPQPLIRVPVNGVFTVIMPDTGAQVTLCEEGYYQQVLRPMDPLAIIQPTDINIQDFAGRNMDLAGMVDMSLKLKNRLYPVRVYLVRQADEPTCPMVLGNDFFEQYELDLHVLRRKNRRVVQIGTTTFPVVHVEPQCAKPCTNSPPDARLNVSQLKPLLYTVFLLSAVTIPPRSSLTVTVGTSFSGSGICLFQPSQKIMERKGLMMPEVTQQAQDNMTHVAIINPSLDYVHVGEDTTLGGAVPVRLINAVKANANETAGTSATVTADMQPNDDELRLKLIRQVEKNTKLSREKKGRLIELLLQNVDIFARSEHDLGRTHLCEHHIEVLEGAQPVSRPAYRLPHALRQKVRAKLDAMKNAGLIEASKSPWAAPLVIRLKPSGEVRITTDFRDLNARTKRDCFPLPHPQDLMDRLKGALYLSVFDLASGYFQVPLCVSDKEKTAFISPFGELLQYTVLAMGLCNAPATFQRLAQEIHDPTDADFMCIYIDDTCVLSQDFESHLRHLEKFFRNVRRAGLKLQPDKCSLAANELKFLGYIVSGQGVKPDPKKITAIQKIGRPASQKDLRSFLGLVNYYRRLIQGFAEVAAPLYKLLEKSQRFYWTPETESAWKNLKNRLSAETMAYHPDFKKPFRVTTDASGVAIGAVLSQEHNATEQPVAFYSRVLTRPERNYCVSEQEGLAVVSAIREWRHYLLLHKFDAFTDHAALTWLLKLKNPSGRLARWALLLQEFSGWMTIHHRPGRLNPVADCLSRLHEDRPRTAVKHVRFSDEEGLSLATVCGEKTKTNQEPKPKTAVVAVNRLPHTSRLRQEQLADPELATIIQRLEGDRPADKTTPIPKEYFLASGVLYHQGEIPGQRLLVVPTQLKAGILEAAHDDLTSGHFGVDKTSKRLAERFHWKGRYTDAKRWVESCRVCIQRKGPSRPTKAPLKPIETEHAPWLRVASDVMGPLRQTARGNRFVVAFTDMFTKYLVAVATPEHTAETVGRLFVERIVLQFGAPLSLLSDRGPEYRSELIQSIGKLCGTRKIFTRPYRPSTNGAIERYNGVMAKAISAYTDGDEWDLVLPFVVFACNTAVHSSLGMSPFHANFGRTARLPVDHTLFHVGTYNEDVSYAEASAKALWSAWSTAEKNLTAARVRQKQQHDKDATDDLSLGIGDLVGLRRHGATPEARKFAKRWATDFIIVDRPNELSAVVQPANRPDADKMTVHVNELFRHPPLYLAPLTPEAPEWLKDQDTPPDTPATPAALPSQPTTTIAPPPEPPRTGPYNLRRRPRVKE